MTQVVKKIYFCYITGKELLISFKWEREKGKKWKEKKWNEIERCVGRKKTNN